MDISAHLWGLTSFSRIEILHQMQCNSSRELSAAPAAGSPAPADSAVPIDRAALASQLDFLGAPALGQKALADSAVQADRAVRADWVAQSGPAGSVAAAHPVALAD